MGKHEMCPDGLRSTCQSTFKALVLLLTGGALVHFFGKQVSSDGSCHNPACTVKQKCEASASEDKKCVLGDKCSETHDHCRCGKDWVQNTTTGEAKLAEGTKLMPVSGGSMPKRGLLILLC